MTYVQNNQQLFAVACQANGEKLRQCCRNVDYLLFEDTEIPLYN